MQITLTTILNDTYIYNCKSIIVKDNCIELIEYDNSLWKYQSIDVKELKVNDG